MAGENSSQLTPNDHRMAIARAGSSSEKGEGCVAAAATHNGSDVTEQCHMTAVEGGYIFRLNGLHFAAMEK